MDEPYLRSVFAPESIMPMKVDMIRGMCPQKSACVVSIGDRQVECWKGVSTGCWLAVSLAGQSDDELDIS